MNIVKAALTNGFILLIPIFAWNIIFTSKLPINFASENMDAGIPRAILVGENIFRAIIFLLPLLLKIDLSTQVGKVGLVIYIIGCIIYFVSWLLVIYSPSLAWSNSIFGFAAPAYTTIIWFVGISLMTSLYNLKITYSRWYYIIPCIIFVGIHVAHSVLAYYKVN